MNKETLLERCQREAREKFRCRCGDERCEANVVRFSFNKMDILVANTLKQAAEEYTRIIDKVVEKQRIRVVYKSDRMYIAALAREIKEALTDAQKLIRGEDNENNV